MIRAVRISAFAAACLVLCGLAHGADAIVVSLDATTEENHWGGENQKYTGEFPLDGKTYSVDFSMGSWGELGSLYLHDDDDKGYEDWQEFPHVLGLAGKLFSVDCRLEDKQLLLVPYAGETGVLKIAKDVTRLSIATATRNVLLYRPGSEARVPVGNFALREYQWTQRALGGKTWYYCAQAGDEPEVVRVREDKEAVLAIGGPYRNDVEATDYGHRIFRKKTRIVGLDFAIRGNCGEDVCQFFAIGGKTDSTPRYKIKDPDGEVVKEGEFEYG